MKPLHATSALPCWVVRLIATSPALAGLSVSALRLASGQPGCLGGDAVEQLTYWDSVEAIAAWRDQVEQLVRQRLGRGAAGFEFAVSRRQAEDACA
ncbi:hypothetical protein [Chromobacterium paludis]|uniref:Antibiotic biosynthesis monooxygenase n=1 Tax=Chromobacterium paludis TaxID=2605945 RepID=A0A5C1DE22_9NEIS|nr:hypothetical protein [Chromobacterium paludis]QEL55014.1 hypothetical protein FYK34_05260 [Chromobacterium paludis]